MRVFLCVLFSSLFSIPIFTLLPTPLPTSPTPFLPFHPSLPQHSLPSPSSLLTSPFLPSFSQPSLSLPSSLPYLPSPSSPPYLSLPILPLPPLLTSAFPPSPSLPSLPQTSLSPLLTSAFPPLPPLPRVFVSSSGEHDRYMAVDARSTNRCPQMHHAYYHHRLIARPRRPPLTAHQPNKPMAAHRCPQLCQCEPVICLPSSVHPSERWYCLLPSLPLSLTPTRSLVPSSFVLVPIAPSFPLLLPPTCLLVPLRSSLYQLPLPFSSLYPQFTPFFPSSCPQRVPLHPPRSPSPYPQLLPPFPLTLTCPLVPPLSYFQSSTSFPLPQPSIAPSLPPPLAPPLLRPPLFRRRGYREVERAVAEHSLRRHWIIALSCLCVGVWGGSGRGWVGAEKKRDN